MRTSCLAASRASRAIFTARWFNSATRSAMPNWAELVAVGAEGIGLDDLCASFDVGLVHVKHRFGVRGIQFVDAALRSDGFVEQGAHGAVGDQNLLGQALVEIFNPHVRLARLDSI